MNENRSKREISFDSKGEFMEGYPVTDGIEVRWRDVDVLGHVNNAVYFTYFEIARGRYFDQVFRRSEFPGITCILLSIQCDFLNPARHGDVVEIGIRVSAVGRTSFDFEYEARLAGSDQVLARSRSTQVLYDRFSKEKIAVTGKWLAEITRVQGKQPHRVKRESR